MQTYQDQLSLIKAVQIDQNYQFEWGYYYDRNYPEEGVYRELLFNPENVEGILIGFAVQYYKSPKLEITDFKSAQVGDYLQYDESETKIIRIWKQRDFQRQFEPVSESPTPVSPSEPTPVIQD